MLATKYKYFMCVVEERSFSAAARKLYLSQANLSKQVTLLEREINITLFDRSGYRPVLTEAGKLLYDECVKVTKQSEKLLKQMSKLEKGSINIGITGIYENKQLIKHINIFKKTNPYIDIRLSHSNFNQMYDKLISQNVDLSFGIESTFNKDQRIAYDILFKYDMCLICSHDHPLSKLKEVTPEMIKNESLIVLSEKFGKNLYRDFIKYCQLDGIHLDKMKKADSFDELLLMVSIGEGISIVSKDVVGENEVKVINLVNSHHTQNYVMAYLKDYDNKAVTSVIEYFKDIKQTL